LETVIAGWIGYYETEINNTAEREMKCLVIIICFSAYIL